VLSAYPQTQYAIRALRAGAAFAGGELAAAEAATRQKESSECNSA
jgi:hypothetical protein